MQMLEDAETMSLSEYRDTIGVLIGEAEARRMNCSPIASGTTPS